MIPFYRLILKRALKISWKFKWLWVFGFFAAFLGQGGVYEFLFRTFGNLSSGQSLFFTLQDYSNSNILGMFSWGRLQYLWANDPSALGLSIFSILLILAFFALMISLAVIGQGALAKGVINADQGRKTTFRQDFNAGLAKFWPILELNFITKVILLGLLMFLAYLASLLVSGSAVWNTILFLIFFVIFIVLGIIIYFLTLYGTAYIVLRDKKVFSALNNAWKIFKKNILINLEMGLLLFIINFIAAIVAMILLFVVMAPLLLLYFIFMFANVWVAGTVLTIIMTIILLVLSILIGAWYNTFVTASWLILFEELALKGGKSKFKRIIQHIRGKIKKA